MSTFDALKARVPLDTRHRIAQWRVQARLPTARWRRLPDVLVIGAQRSGTSTLFKHLGRHPDLAPSRRKEVEYFSRRYGRGEDWYRAHFELEAGRRRIAFEATPDYLFHPLSAGRAAEVVPAARIVVMLRDPVDRAWSHYHHMVALGHEPLGFDDAVAAEDDRCADDLARLADDPLHDPVQLLRHSYVSRGLYAGQLRRWFEHFERDRVLVVRSEDFFGEPSAVFGRIVEFIGARPWQPSAFSNVSRAGRSTLPAPSAAIRDRLAGVFEASNDELVALLGDTAPRW